jgi:hypothetical protein
VADRGVVDGLADAFEDEGRHDGSVEGPYAIYNSLCVVEGVQDRGVGSEADLLAVWVDIPQAFDARRQLLFISFRKSDVLLAQGGEGAREVSVFDTVVFFEFVGDGRGVAEFKGSGDGRMGDGVLTSDYIAVGEADRDMVREVGVDGGEDGGVARDGANAGEEVDGGLE